MRIIDLLNKLANGENAPKELIYDNWRWHLKHDGYYNHILNDELTNYILKSKDWEEYLNTEIKVGSFKKYKKNRVERLTGWFDEDELENARYNTEKRIVDKINEIIDYLDYLKSKGEK
jgi:hypothetical protein